MFLYIAAPLLKDTCKNIDKMKEPQHIFIYNKENQFKYWSCKFSFTKALSAKLNFLFACKPKQPV